MSGSIISSVPRHFQICNFTFSIIYALESLSTFSSHLCSRSKDKGRNFGGSSRWLSGKPEVAQKSSSNSFLYLIVQNCVKWPTVGAKGAVTYMFLLWHLTTPYAVSKNGGGIWILSGKLATSVTLTHSIVFLFLLKSPKNFWCRNGTLCFPTKYSVPKIQRVIREYTFLFILSFLSLFATLPVVILGKNPQISESHLILLHCSYSHLVNCHGNICTFSFAPPHPNSFSSPITLVCKCLSPSLVFPKSSWLNCQHPLWSLPLPPCTSSWNLTFVMLYVFLKIFVGFLFPTS